MAELAVGLTKSVVEVVLTKAQAALEQEGKLRKSAQRQLVFITDEFQMMQSFLVVADEERVGNVVVMTWVRQIRELAYDMEDSIEFVVHLNKSGWWRRLLHSMTPPCVPTAALPLDEAVEEIEQLKQRVEDVSRRNARYSLISDTGSKPVAQQAPSSSSSRSAGAAGAINLLLLQDMDAGTGKRQQGDLTQFITDQDHDGHGQDLQVISVWGTGGDLGTTSLIRKAYSDPEICTTFACRAWVKLLVRPFDPCEFVRCLVAQFHANSCCTDENIAAVPVGLHFLKQQMKDDGAQGGEGHLFHKFERQVTENRYLVVLEGLSDMQEWDAIRSFLPDMKNGSRIIVSTQQFEIARLCIGQSAQVLQLEQFSADHSVCAFFRQVRKTCKNMNLPYYKLPGLSVF